MSDRRSAFWTHDDEAAKDVGHCYYFAPSDRVPPPYKMQRHVRAIIDIAADGTLAGVELIDDMPPPPNLFPSDAQTMVSKPSIPVLDGHIDDTKDKFKLHYPKEPGRW